MSSAESISFDNLHDNQICYVKCCFCTTILQVGVPYSSLGMVVTISCGQCGNIFYVEMMKACLPLSSSVNQMPKLEVCTEQLLADNQHHILQSPEKKRRAPTKYNCFIKEEIKRLKTEHPNMTHKQAFSAASKNWAHFPQSEYGCDEGDRMHSTVDDEGHCLGNALHEKKALMQSVSTTPPFY